MNSAILAESRRLRLVTFGILYAVQGIPDAMVLILFPAYLAANGASATVIGTFLATAMLPNVAKLLVGPFIDRHATSAMGRRRPWLISGQLALASSFAALAFLENPAHHIGWFMTGAFAITLTTVLQDVATDATAIDLVPPDEQGHCNSIMWGAKTLGTAGAASVGAVILAVAGFSALVLSAVGILIGSLLLVLLIRERADDHLLPWVHRSAHSSRSEREVDGWRSIALNIILAFRSAMVVRLVLLSLVIGLVVGMTGTLAPILMVKQFGWEQGEYAQFRSALKLVSGIGGLFLGGFLIRRFGHSIMIMVTLGLICFSNLLFAAVPTETAASYFLTAYEMLLVFTFITFFAATMTQCAGPIAATQFSFIMVCGNLTMSLGAALTGSIVENLGVGAVSRIIAGICGLGALVMAGWRPARQKFA